MNTRKALAWSFSQQFGQNGLQFIGSIVIARLLTPDEMGVFALAIAATVLISSLRDFGIGSYLIREEQLTNDKIRTAFGIWITVSWTLGIVVLSVRHYVAGLYDTPGIADVLLLLSISFFITPLGQPVNALLQREMRFDVLHHINLASAAVAVGTSVTLALAGMSYMALAWGMVSSTIVRSLLLIAVRPEYIRMLPSFRYWRDVLRFGGLLTATSLVGTINSEGIKFMLGGFINPAAVAFYDRAAQMPVFGRQALFAPLGRVLFPAFSKDIREGVTIGPSVVKLIAATTVIIWPAFLTIGFLSVPIVVFLFGENWRIAGEIMPYILLAHAISATLPQPYQILVPHGKVQTLFWLIVFGTANNLTLVAIGSMHGLKLFAYLQPVQAAMFITASYFCQRRYWQADVREVLTKQMKAIVIALIAAVPAAGARFEYGVDVPVAVLFGVAFSAPLIWLTAIFLFKHDLSQELSSMLNRGWLIISRTRK